MQPLLFTQLTASKCYCAENELGQDKWELLLYLQRDVQCKKTLQRANELSCVKILLLMAAEMAN